MCLRQPLRLQVGNPMPYSCAPGFGGFLVKRLAWLALPQAPHYLAKRGEAISRLCVVGGRLLVVGSIISVVVRVCTRARRVVTRAPGRSDGRSGSMSSQYFSHIDGVQLLAGTPLPKMRCLILLALAALCAVVPSAVARPEVRGRV